jgi:hypothetical protein
MNKDGKSLSEKYGIKFYIKTDEELELEFESNKKTNKTLEPQYRLPESIIEYAERLLIENSRSIQSIEKENIPAFVKSERLKYLQKHEELLLEWIKDLENV